MNARASRPEAWRSLMQRGVDTAAEWSDVLAEKLNAASDPRSKLLRKRRWALRLAVFFAVWRGPGNMLYEAMAREKDEPHRTFFILVPPVRAPAHDRPPSQHISYAGTALLRSASSRGHTT